MRKLSRLRTLPPRIGALPQRIGVAAGDEQARSRQRDASQAYRAWYKTAAWQKKRLKILERDLYTCQRTGVLLIGKYPAGNSPVVDHKRPHRGDERLFWDDDNLHSVSKAFHDSVKQSEERRGC